MGGFVDRNLARNSEVEAGYEGAGALENVFGQADAVSQAIRSGGRMNGVGELPGAGPAGYLGLAQSGLGLANNIHSMVRNGVTVDNALGATENTAGIASWGLGTFGAKGSLAAKAAPVAGAAAFGIGTGTRGNKFVSDRGWLGQNSDGSGGRSWSDMAADWGGAAHDWAGGGFWGQAAGLGATAVGSLVGTVGAAGTGLMGIGEDIGRGAAAAGRGIGRGARAVGRGASRGARAAGRGIKRGVGAVLSW